MDNGRKINIEVAYARPDRDWLIPVIVSEGTTIISGIRQSGILDQCPEIDPGDLQAGVFSRKMPLDTLLNDGDRIEIYRPLKIDPKEARRKRTLV